MEGLGNRFGVGYGSLTSMKGGGPGGRKREGVPAIADPVVWERRLDNWGAMEGDRWSRKDGSWKLVEIGAGCCGGAS